MPIDREPSMEPTTEFFALHLDEGDGDPYVRLVGDLDLIAAPLLRQCLHDHAGQKITLDFSAVTFMDSTAIGVLVAARNRSAAEAGNGAIVLRNVQPMQRQVLSLTGVDDLFDFDDGQVS